MIDWFLSVGVIVWPLLALALGVVAAAVRAALRLGGAARASDGASDPATSDPGAWGQVLAPVLLWGVVALLVGALGTVTGLVIMARRISDAGGASAALVGGGVSVALTSLALGTMVFLLAGVLWLALDAWARRIAVRAGVAIPALVLLAVSGLLTGCGNADAVSFVVSDSAGIRVAANLGPDRPFPATPVRLASLQPPDSALTAVPWGVVTDPGTGRIFVADMTSERVVIFEADGTFVRTIGRAGGGPGEFRSPTALAMDGSGALAVWDARRGVISRWSVDGDFLDERRAPLNYWGPGFAVRGDGVLAVTQSTTGNQQRQSLVHATGTGELSEIFAVVRELVPMDLPGMNMPAPRIFAPDLIWTTLGDTVLVLDGPVYRIDAYVGGRPIASTRRDVEPIVVTDELAAARVGSGPYRAFMRRGGLTPERIVAAVGHEELASPIEWIVALPSGELWVSRGSGLPVPDRIDVFAPDGRYRGTFDAPGFPVAFLPDSRFVALEITEFGEPVLGLYRLDPARGGEPMSPGKANPSEDRVDQAPPRSVRGASRPGTASSEGAWSPPPPDSELRPGDEFRDCARCPVVVVLPPGRFVMGSPEGEAVGELSERWHHLLRFEKPRVEVEIGYSLAMGKYEVTFAEWDACVEAGGCSHEPDDEGFGRGERPVLNVNRLQAEEYLRWLSQVTGQVYRLPSEAEWEYAARAGTTTARHWGDGIGEGMAACAGCGGRWNGRSTAPVGSFPPNDFGLHDMLGNVYEWVSDCYHRGHDGVPTDGSPRIETSPYWEDGTCTVHVRRGGSWALPAWQVRAAHRKAINTRGPWGLAGDRHAGFRVVRELAA